jgi:hypothetical protein
MADQRNRGGKKRDTGRRENAQGRQGVRDRPDRAGTEGVPRRPAEGQPGGPKPKSKSGRGQ